MLLRQRVFTSFGCCSKENLGIRRLSFRLIGLIGAAKMKTLRYSSGYYDSLYDDSARSARRVVPLLVKMFSPRTVIDVGCGSGTWARSFKHAGCQVTGVDGEHVKRERLLITEQEFRRHDLNRPFKSDQRFDLAVSLEVAEHLPAERAGLLSKTCAGSARSSFSPPPFPDKAELTTSTSSGLPTGSSISGKTTSWPAIVSDRKSGKIRRSSGGIGKTCLSSSKRTSGRRMRH